MYENNWALVVDDDAHSLIAIGSILKDLGVRYKRNTTGADVVRQVREMRPLPDFILLDLDLPEGDPFKITKALQADAELAAIPVIAIANDSLMNLLPQTRNAGFAGFITKPLPRRQFGDLLNRIFMGEQVWQVMA